MEPAKPESLWQWARSLRGFQFEVATRAAVVALGQFGAEILIGRHYGAALLFVTPLALTVAHLTSPVPALLVDRVLETVLGSVVAQVIVLLVRARARRQPALPG
ncbi:FUSC family protein [Cryobacterium sp. Hh7]|uniref:FUSC family protein n=1 Tax=Cryobacterium sp. Hh7 TaxID=1259159 RepID=UPI00106C3C27|nr:FUSC family protein [Cryobacterium sp. Hh7]TFD57479.1 FUSC family protein [Cryobacterium sp. Hh7]